MSAKKPADFVDVEDVEDGEEEVSFLQDQNIVTKYKVRQRRAMSRSDALPFRPVSHSSHSSTRDLLFMGRLDGLRRPETSPTSVFLPPPRTWTDHSFPQPESQKALKAVLEACVEGAKIIDLCQLGDKVIEDEAKKVYNKGGIMKGSFYVLAKRDTILISRDDFAIQALPSRRRCRPATLSAISLPCRRTPRPV